MLKNKERIFWACLGGEAGWGHFRKSAEKSQKFGPKNVSIYTCNEARRFYDFTVGCFCFIMLESDPRSSFEAMPYKTKCLGNPKLMGVVKVTL